MNHLSFFFIRIILHVFFKVFNRLEVIGQENIPKQGGVIIAANHISYLDPPVIGAALKRRPTYIAKEGLFRIPVLGRIIESFSFPVNPERPQPSTMKKSVSQLRRGNVLVIFPEGGRSTDSSMLAAKRGVGMIADISTAPVVPTLIEGTDSALPAGRKFIRPAKIKIKFGIPLQIKKIGTKKDCQERLSKEIMDRIRKLQLVQ